MPAFFSTLSTLAASLALAAPAGAAADAAEAPPGLFVLPVRTDRWSGTGAGSSLPSGEPRLLEARLAAALARGGRLRVLGPRDVPAEARGDLPKDLAACVTPACLGRLGAATGAERVLGLEILETGEGPILFATLYDAAGGGGDVAGRRELPRPALGGAARGWAEEVARWVRGDPPPPAPHPTDGEARVALELAPGQGARPEARALLYHLGARFRANGRPLLAVPGDPGPRGLRTHRGVITVERMAISERVRHIHRYRRGTLDAALVVTDARDGRLVFAAREGASFVARSAEATDRQVLDALAAELASRWLLRLLEEPSALPLMTEKGDAQ